MLVKVTPELLYRKLRIAEEEELRKKFKMHFSRFSAHLGAIQIILLGLNCLCDILHSKLTVFEAYKALNCEMYKKECAFKHIIFLLNLNFLLPKVLESNL